MAYTTEAIVRAESPFKDSSRIDSTYVARAIAEADNFINARISNVYQVPFDASDVPTDIQDISTRLAIYNVLREQNLNIEIASGVNIQAMVDDSLAILEAIAKRQHKLIKADGTEYPLSNVMNPSFYPTQASTDAGLTKPQFTMNKQF